ncbi:MAG: hypothetical protein A2268_03385 [Candidatus Raymondbacteria bacterium RifOxyA12_full_50_37]|nr:MAG: hypothetical protein A2268_03385 [Candidatus Raymondbacteria bacterium RifOxyA12_full_50_37]OGJ87481.1 MAG: hypothetical protein A2248_22125 [Candidatus Raymondbacteria bacterium RIFOXYA2_FULL_49_16]OGJ94891.1 MAG: hypothetical protein A2487_11435 [Candidatus Raymondbacteria bacterium RifOxyC12_full_50_8]OGJ96421.1 MAG: hypothetical protein A2453_01740 [Candidatus Raymondbacteria bacterium RIFOXYC2_FULL_50_21]OGJ99564.1 MAG: hypothetical protein A2350_10080 [Candidatus Raymondbacteria b
MKNRLRTAHIITRLDRGGSTDNTLYSALFADKAAFEVFVVSGPTDHPEGAIQKRARAEGVIFLTINAMGREINPIRDILACIKLFSFIKKHRIKIVHTHTSKAGIVGRIAAFFAYVPAIVHTPHGHVFWGYYSPAFTRLFMITEKICGWLGHSLVALTQAEKDDYVRLKVEQEKKITIAPSGLELSLYRKTEGAQARATLGIAHNAFVIGTVARFEKIKNHATLLKAATLLCDRKIDFIWVFVGDGVLLPGFKKEAQEAGLLQHMIFTGWRDDIPAILPAFDIFVLASLNEGMGRVFVEAQACGLPVVGSDVCGIANVVKNNKTGILVKPDDSASIAETIGKLHADPELRKTMGSEALAAIAEEYNVHAMVHGLETLYRDLLMKKMFEE